LPDTVRRSVESSYGVDMSGVRVHSDAQANRAAAAMSARAFTVGGQIFLGRGEQATDLALMAHEAAHVVQQQAGPALQRSAPGQGDAFEHEADRASEAAQGGSSFVVQGRAGGPRAQKQGIIEGGAAWLQEKTWAKLEEHAPSLVPILKKGVLEWLKEKLGGAVQAVVDSVSGPIRTVQGVATTVRKHFGALVAWLRDAAAKIARNDCSPISEAADKIYQVFDGLASPAIERVGEFVDKVKKFFQEVWNRFGAPVWDLLKRIGGAVWEEIQRVGKWIWEKTKPIRDFLDAAWTRFKNWLGIGEGEEGQNGVLQWFQRKAGAAWDWVMAKIAPFKRQLLIITAVLVMLSPAGPYIAIIAAAAGILRGVQWLRQNFRKRGAVVQQRNFLRGVILPAILGAIGKVSDLVRNAASAITGALNKVMGAVNELAATVGGIPLLGFISGLIGFLADGFRGLVEWANEGVQGLATRIQNGLQILGRLATRLVDFLEEIGRATKDLFRLVGATFRRFWDAIPGCVRDPFIDYFVPLILSNIPFFSELASSPEAWQKTRAQITKLVEQVFVDFDLLGAIQTAFGIVVRILRIPIDLMEQLIDKASEAWDLVVAAPLRFIENSIKAILQGIGRFMKNILSHLWFGVQGWLLNSVGDKGITLPTGLTDWRGWLNLVLDILGLSVDHVIELIDKRFPGAGKRLRQGLNFLTGALRWLNIALTEGPRGIWRELMNNLKDLGNIVIGGAVKWVMSRIIAIVSARLTALAASAGLTSVLEAVFAVYQAIQTAIEYARRIIVMLIGVFDTIIQIATGNLPPAAEKLEQSFRAAMPVVIGFLANYAGLGGVGNRIREILQEVRQRVDDAILGLIDSVKGAIQRVLDMIKSGVQKILAMIDRQFDAGGEPHRLYIDRKGGGGVLTISSVPEPILSFLTKAEANANIPQNNKAHIPRARQLAGEMGTLITRVDGGSQQGKDVSGDQRTLSTKEQELVSLIQKILKGVSISQFNEVYKLEGLVGTFSSVQGQAYDQMTPDHQPQAAILKSVAEMPIFKGRAIQTVVSGHATGAITINLHKNRHGQGRTFGTKGARTAAAARAEIQKRITPFAGDESRQRDETIRVLREELDADVAAMNAVANRAIGDVAWTDVNNLPGLSQPEKDKLIIQVRQQIAAGENRIRSQSLERYKE
jgi:hypothetical protein